MNSICERNGRFGRNGMSERNSIYGNNVMCGRNRWHELNCMCLSFARCGRNGVFDKCQVWEESLVWKEW